MTEITTHIPISGCVADTQTDVVGRRVRDDCLRHLDMGEMNHVQRPLGGRVHSALRISAMQLQTV